MEHIRYVLFDLGSTLIHFDAHWPDVMPKAIRAMYHRLVSTGISIPADVFLPVFQQRLENYYIERDTEFIEYTTTYLLDSILSELGMPPPNPEVVQSAVNAFYNVSQQHWHAAPDAHTTLQALREHGFRLAIISNAADDNDVQSLVDQAGFRPYFELILSSATIGVRKPNPRIFQFALNYFRATPLQAAMIGDTLGADILGAQLVGLLDIWASRYADTPANRAHRETIIPTHTITTLAEIPELLTEG